MLNTKTSERTTWVNHREYTDSQGNLYIEYKDAQGILHTEAKNPVNNSPSYQEGYVAGQILEENKREEQISQTKRADKNISQGLLLGVIVTCIAGLSAGVIYFLVGANQPQPTTIVSVPRLQSSPVPSPLTPAPVVLQPVVKVVPIPQVQPREVKVNITTQPVDSKPQVKPKKVAVTKVSVPPTTKASTAAIAPTIKPTAVAPVPNNITNNVTTTTNTKPVDVPKATVPNDNISNPNLTRRDRDLKNEILQTLQDQFSDNQLIVEVNQTDVVVSGSVSTPEQLQQIKPLLLSIQGIGNVEITAITSH